MPILSMAERAILINQFKILSEITQDYDAYKDEIRILSSGYESLYEEIDGISGFLPEDECRFVYDILFLYYKMKLSKVKDRLDSLPQIDGRTDLRDVEPKFPGFDGNGEPGLYGFASFLINDRGEFPEHKHYLNSHGPHLNYRAMLVESSKYDGQYYSEEQIQAILDAGKHR